MLNLDARHPLREPPGLTAVRHAYFGEHGEGILTLLVDEEAETLPIIDILWLG